MSKLKAIIKTACPPTARGLRWGDFYFARSLSESLLRLGVSSQIEAENGKVLLINREPKNSSEYDIIEFDLWIRGMQKIEGGPNPAFAWFLYGTRHIDIVDLKALRHIFVASEPFGAHLANFGLPASCLLQCTDTSLFSPIPSATDPKYEALFVGNQYSRRMKREIVYQLVDASVPLSLWGRGQWSEDILKMAYKGMHISNADLPAHYRGAKVVVNDHKAEMRGNGFLSNRAFDVLASGTAFVTEDMVGIPDDIRDELFLYAPGKAVEATKAALEQGHLDRGVLAERIRRDHSFDNRAERLMTVVREYL